MGYDKMILLVDGHHGQYVPIVFIDVYDVKQWHIVEFANEYRNADEMVKCDIWCDILDKAYFTDDNGFRWTLYQDMDLWAVREDYEWED